MDTSEEMVARSVKATAGSRKSALDLPFVLPTLLVAATWELLLLRLVLPAAEGLGEEMAPFLVFLSKVGVFCEFLAAILGLVLLLDVVVSLVRDPSFGPILHRLTVCGFAAAMIGVCAVGTVTTVSSETALLAR